LRKKSDKGIGEIVILKGYGNNILQMNRGIIRKGIGE
jgi:hypothetical protein